MGQSSGHFTSYTPDSSCRGRTWTWELLPLLGLRDVNAEWRHSRFGSLWGALRLLWGLQRWCLGTSTFSLNSRISIQYALKYNLDVGAWEAKHTPRTGDLQCSLMYFQKLNRKNFWMRSAKNWHSVKGQTLIWSRNEKWIPILYLSLDTKSIKKTNFSLSEGLNFWFFVVW